LLGHGPAIRSTVATSIGQLVKDLGGMFFCGYEPSSSHEALRPQFAALANQ
jgi:hypothetical protein